MLDLFAPLLLLIFKLLVVVAVAMLTMVFVAGAAPNRPSARGFLLPAALHAAVVLLLMVFWVNRSPGFFAENDLAFGTAGGIKRLARGTPNPMGQQGADLILIDNSHDKTLISYAESAEGEDRTLAITDRRKLTDLFNLLADHQDQVALVVCDILFEESTPEDSALSKAISRLAGADKVILAQGSLPNQPLLRFNVRATGKVTTELQKEKVVWHELLPEGQVSLPYQMYTRTLGITSKRNWTGFFLQEQRGDSSWTVYPAFLPAMDRFDEQALALPASEVGEVFMNAPDLLPVPLGKVLTPAGQAKMLRRLQRAGTRPIVFIGEFSTRMGEHAGADVHDTFRGNLHGSSILINLYLELLGGAHYLKMKSLVWQWAFLFVVSLNIFRRPWGTCLRCFATSLFRLKPMPLEYLASGIRCPKHPGSKKATKASSDHSVGRAINKVIVVFFWKKIKDIGPSLLLCALFLVLDFFFNDHVNLGALFFYFVILDAFFQKLDLQKTAHHETGKTIQAPG